MASATAWFSGVTSFPRPQPIAYAKPEAQLQTDEWL
jgi:hypothetical protein